MGNLPRLYTPGLHGLGTLSLDGEQARRLGAVMRLRSGDRFLAFGGDGREWDATITKVARGTVEAQVGAKTRELPQPPRSVEIGIAIVRPNRMDWAVEKCTEAGADVIRPLVTEHATRGSAEGRTERWQRIAIEAAEQSGRLFVPAVAGAATLDALVASRAAVVFGALDGERWDVVAETLPRDGVVLTLVGPEGGFSEGETTALRAAGGRAVCLGPNVLRTETAAVVFTALLRATER